MFPTFVKQLAARKDIKVLFPCKGLDPAPPDERRPSHTPLSTWLGGALLPLSHSPRGAYADVAIKGTQSLTRQGFDGI